MGVALSIVPEREVPGLDVFVNGKALGHAKHLDRLAVEAGVRPLMEFFSQDSAEAEAWIVDEGMEPPEGGFPPIEWFPAEDGLTTVHGLLAPLATNPSSLPSDPAIVEDLREFQLVLSRLAEAGVRWHLAADL